jgi:hypothetical protein
MPVRHGLGEPFVAGWLPDGETVAGGEPTGVCPRLRLGLGLGVALVGGRLLGGGVDAVCVLVLERGVASRVLGATTDAGTGRTSR